MKKIVIVMFSFLLFGCSTNQKKIKIEKEQPMYFLYATPLADHPIWLQSKEGFEEACKELNVKCDWIGPKIIDTEKMKMVISQGIYQKADGIITQGVVDPSLLEKAKDANIPVAIVDSNMKADKFAYYGKNFETQANLMLEEIEKKLGKEKELKIAIQVAELNFKIAQDQIQEIRNVFKQHPGGFEIVDISESKSDKIHAQSEWMDTLKAHPELNVTINFAAESADACGEIAETLGVKDQLYVFGVDDMSTTIEYIEKGLVDASIVTSFYEYGYRTVHQMYEYKKTGTLPKQKENEVKLIVVNKENVHSYKEDLK